MKPSAPTTAARAGRRPVAGWARMLPDDSTVHRLVEEPGRARMPEASQATTTAGPARLHRPASSTALPAPPPCRWSGVEALVQHRVVGPPHRGAAAHDPVHVRAEHDLL